jgi:hypothetical protein
VPRSVGDDSSFAASASSAIARADPSPHLTDVVLPVRTNWDCRYRLLGRSLLLLFLLFFPFSFF